MDYDSFPRCLPTAVADPEGTVGYQSLFDLELIGAELTAGHHLVECGGRLLSSGSGGQPIRFRKGPGKNSESDPVKTLFP